MKKILILLLTAFLSSGSLSAQSVDIELLRRTAEQGYMEAQYQLGLLYTKGNSKNLSSYSHNRVSEGVPPDYIRDYDLAIKWLRLAADQDYARAQNLLGLMYDLGRGVPQDYVQAMKWYRLAADQNYAPAQGNIGQLYYRGEGVPQDFSQALKWYRLAADQGDANAQANLGDMYAEGEVVTKDLVQAHKWYNLAIASQPAGVGRTAYEKKRADASSQMSPKQIARAQELASKWIPGISDDISQPAEAPTNKTTRTKPTSVGYSQYPSSLRASEESLRRIYAQPAYVDETKLSPRINPVYDQIEFEYENSIYDTLDGSPAKPFTSIGGRTVRVKGETSPRFVYFPELADDGTPQKDGKYRNTNMHIRIQDNAVYLPSIGAYVNKDSNGNTFVLGQDGTPKAPLRDIKMYIPTSEVAMLSKLKAGGIEDARPDLVRTSTSSQSKNQFSTPLKKGASMALVMTISQVLAVMAAFFSTWSLMKRFDKKKVVTKISLTLLGGLTAFFANIISLIILTGLGLYDDKWPVDAQIRAGVPPLYFGLFTSWMTMRENSWVVGFFKKMFPKLVN